MGSPRDFLRPIGVLVAIVVGVGVNVPIPRDVGAVAERTAPLLAAAPWTFSIWGVIFGWMLAFGVWQALPAQRSSRMLDGIAPWAIVNALGGAAWTLLFTRERFVAAWLVMLAILVALVVIERRTFIARRNGGTLLAQHALVRAPFTLNLGWICVATILNTAQVLAVHGIDHVGPVSAFTGAAVCIVGAVLLGVVLVVVRRARWAGAAIAWGLAGVGAEMLAKDGALAKLAFAGCILLVGAVAVSFASRARSIARPIAHRPVA